MSLKVAVLAPINKVNFDAGEIILFIMTDQKSEMRSVGSTNDVISIGLTESELTQLASDIGLSMGVLRLSPIERGRLCKEFFKAVGRVLDAALRAVTVRVMHVPSVRC